jgi:predicted RNase H-like HicB family nuclease
MELQLTAIFEEVPESEGGGYTAWCEELPGAISEGDTLEEARANLRDAIHLLLETLRDERNKTSTAGHRIIREKISVPAA